MKFVYRFLFLALFIIAFSFLALQAQDRPHKTHPDDTFQKIDRAFQEGKITLDKKVLYKLYAAKNIQRLPQQYRMDGEAIVKCGTPAMAEFQNKKSQLSAATVGEAESIIGSRTLQASETYPSPSGNFAIHYETSGPDAVPQGDQNNNNIPDYVEEVAAAADSSYRHEVQRLGYTDPLTSQPQIDVYILDLNSPDGGKYGQSNGTYIEIENDFSENFPPNDDPEGEQIGAIKVTMAHELKHVVQYSANQWQGEVFDWLEMDATLMEEVVYDNVNDYYNYIRSTSSIFNSPEQSFYPGSYNHVSWALYFEEQFGPQFWVETWEIIAANPNIDMVDAITQQLGGTEAFNRNYAESQLWHFASGANSTQAYGFEESAEYPTPNVTVNFVGADSLTNPNTLDGFSATYFEVQPSSSPGFVGFDVLDLETPHPGLGIIAYFNDGHVEPLILFNDQQQTINHKTAWRWQDISKLGIIAANSSTQQQTSFKLAVNTIDPVVDVEQNYPNPFREQTTIEYSIPEQKHVTLEIFDVLGRKVATLVDESQNRGTYPQLFEANGLASGIYFYSLTIDGEVVTKKMTLIK